MKNAKSNGQSSQFKKALESLTPGHHTISLPVTLDTMSWVMLQTEASKRQKTLGEAASEILNNSDAGL